ncbi:hypothetical protein GCM10012320_10190 [Sinomonas cellulolyticus]|uniref:Nuclease SbcCD subunit C n=1 Tax=Sinomonas cellulolyticus TaxID=2801916 RepID=A0ABS1K4B9_9MICC|nr:MULTISPECIES: SMC family ATPase [Sinomonas]MBL0706475.1 SMC family ATPase [Sinomonas cellulolyticus]GHG44826.1 hypothetical protein GCM10012320_10190 [Sinomonas sp. KCTC 49339]
MRLHSLRIAAFGPFAGEESIDFDALAEHGLFLLNGPTGSGKTSILDAVCYALYGSLPGARQGTKSLKSHHAPGEAEPAVLLEFSARGRRFEVRRTPEWSRPSVRSSAGWVTQKASTHVRELVDGEWRALTSRNDEAGALLAEVVGMAREQFTRVVLLPQGEFASFLRAKASERVDLLERLFGTQRFADVEAELAALAQAARAREEKAERAVAMPVARLEAEVAAAPDQQEADPAAGGDDEDAAPPPDPDGPIDVRAAEARFHWADAAFARRQERALAARGPAERALADSRAAAAALLRALEDAGELAQARARRQAWESQGDAHRARCERLVRHAAARGLRGPLDDARAAARQAAAARAAAVADVEGAVAAGWDRGRTEQAPEPLSRTGAATGGAGLPGMDEVRNAALSASTEEAILSEHAAAEHELAARETALGAARRALADAESRVGRLALEAEDLARELSDLAAEQERLEPVAATLAAARLEAEAAEAVVAAVQDHAGAVGHLADCAEQLERYRGAALDARQSWLDLRERRLQHSAAELAAQLADAEPCPVCGSAEHPAPAVGAEDPLALVDAERRAAQEYEAARGREDRAKESVAAAREALAAIEARGGATDPDKAVRLREDRLSAVAAAEEADDRLRLVTERTGALGRQRDRALDARDAAAESRIRAEAAAVQGAEDVGRLRAEVEAWRAGFATVDARRLHVAALARTLSALEDSLLRCHTASAEERRAATALEQALGGTDFTDEAAARAALLDDGAAALEEARARAHEAEGQQLEGLFASAAVRRAIEAEGEAGPPSTEELESLRAAEAAAERRLRAVEAAAQAAAAARVRAAALREDFEARVPALEDARERSTMLTELARTVRGQGENERRMSLHSYVLAARLEQVALAATERLLAMSDGRFSLEHSDALAARGAASGLGLDIVDAWTGQRRDPSTLSGGESFMAALSLALGLADVVQHESGGIDIETLFVDEGFGSLDEQALEQVMDAIEGLRAGGRVVGLVSHVSELKQRIPAQIVVAKGRTGSHIASVGVVAEKP